MDNHKITNDEILSMRNKSNGFSNLIGLKVTKLEKGYAEAEMHVDNAHSNPQASVHGGVLMTIADTVAGSAVAYCGEMIATIEGSLHFLRPVMSKQKLLGVGKEIKSGKNIMVASADIYDEEGTHIATGIYSFANLHKPLAANTDLQE